MRYLFRFRDLVAPTLDEHVKIINDRGKCWWGWWKRPSESSRQEIWQALASTASVESPTKVGLFDSGSGQVFEALVTAVIGPQSGNSPGQSHPPVPPDEQALIPAYYRNSPFSYAWMRLVKVEKNPIPFFGHFSFASVPQLPNYAPHALSRLMGKVILEPDELRGMDTTIWEVRPRSPSDNDEKVILTVPALFLPISSQPVGAPSSKILHITDPHFAVGKNRQKHVWRLENESNTSRFSLTEAVEKALSNQRIGVVIVTGDLTFTGLQEEYHEAATSLARLLGLLDLAADNLIVIPGNHDIQWTTDEIYNENAVVTNAPAAAKANYIEFYRTVFGHDAHETLAMGRRYLLPNGIVLEVCGLNSSSLETGKNFLAGVGRIEESAFGKVRHELGWMTSATMALRILALHHHLVH